MLGAAAGHVDLDDADAERAEERRVAGEEGDVAPLGAGDDHVGLTREQDALRRDDLDLHRHMRLARAFSCSAFLSRSSMPPTLKNACSGISSNSPSSSLPNASTVSVTGTLVPGICVNGSPAYIGWPRNFSILRARATSTLSSSVSSSMPRMAMMSWSSL